MLDSISRHNSKTLHVFRIFDFDLEPAQIFENVPSPVLAKSPTGIGQFANRYWPIRQPVLTKSSTGIGQFANRYWPNRQPVLANLPTGIDEIINQYWRNLMLVYLGRNNFFCPGNFFANSSQIYIIRWRPFPSNKIHSPSGGYPANVTGISGYLLQNDYRKWNFPMTQSVCCSVRWFIVWSVGRPVGL